MNKEADHEMISLLWPDINMVKATHDCSGMPGFTADLEIDPLTLSLCVNRKYQKFIKTILLSLCSDKQTIEYRLDIVDDLLRNPHMIKSLELLLPLLDELACQDTASAQTTPLLATVKRFGELELYVQCICLLADSFAQCGETLQSQGLGGLRDRVDKIYNTDSFRSLRQNIPVIKSRMEKMASVTIGVNLDAQLRPCEATVISINDKRYKGSQLLTTLFSTSTIGADEYTGISELHSIVESVARSEIDSMKKVLKEGQSLQVILFNDLHKILNKSLAPVLSVIKQYTQFSSSFLIKLENEIAFYLGVVRLIQTIRGSGLCMCRPFISDDDRNCFNVNDAYYINLALRRIAEGFDGSIDDAIITNDISFDEGGNVFILTGPNRGGKTTYLQTVGITQILAQTGCYVPGSHAEIGIADMIFTHFPVEEKPGDNSGRLGEEAKRLSEILHQATSKSLVLLNESISSTSPSENLQISRDVVFGLKLIGLRAVFATHLHDLAEGLDEVNTQYPQGNTVVSIVAGVDETNLNGRENGRTYKVVRSKPRGSSFSIDIAVKYGISREQIINTLTQRNILKKDLPLSRSIRR